MVVALVPICIGIFSALNSSENAKKRISKLVRQKHKENIQAKKKYTSIPKDKVWDKIVKILANYFSIKAKSITPQTNFVNDLNVDSLDIAELVVKAEKEFQINISNQEIDTMTLVGDAYFLISKKINSEA